MRFKSEVMMRIGELAERAGTTVRALRYYEEEGLLTSERTTGGQRLFEPTAIERVRLLQTLYGAGMSSRVIAEVVIPCVENPSADNQGAAWERMTEELRRIEAKIAEMQRTRKALTHLLREHEEACMATDTDPPEPEDGSVLARS